MLLHEESAEASNLCLLRVVLWRVCWPFSESGLIWRLNLRAIVPAVCVPISADADFGRLAHDLSLGRHLQCWHRSHPAVFVWRWVKLRTLRVGNGAQYWEDVSWPLKDRGNSSSSIGLQSYACVLGSKPHWIKWDDSLIKQFKSLTTPVKESQVLRKSFLCQRPWRAAASQSRQHWTQMVLPIKEIQTLHGHGLIFQGVSIPCPFGFISSLFF